MLFKRSARCWLLVLTYAVPLLANEFEDHSYRTEAEPLQLGWRRAEVSLEDITVSALEQLNLLGVESLVSSPMEVRKHFGIRFTISMKSQNMDELKSIVKRISDPSNKNYGAYLSSLEINELTKPTSQAIATVREWLASAQMEYEYSETKQLFDVKASIQATEFLLKTTLHVLENDSFNKRIIRACEFFVPNRIHNVVGAIYGLHGLPLSPRELIDSAESTAVTPAVLASTYSIEGVEPTGSTAVLQAVPEFQGQYEKDSDLASFFQMFVSNAKTGDERIYRFEGDPDKQTSGVEASLDIQYIMGVAPHVKTEFWMYANFDFCGDLKNWTSSLLTTTGVPLVHSVSYGWQGDLHAIQCEMEKVYDVDDAFVKLAARGISIIFSSGDSGSGYSPSGFCHQSDPGEKGIALTGKIEKRFTTTSAWSCCERAQDYAKAFTFLPSVRPGYGSCIIWRSVTGKKVQIGAISGNNPPSPPKLYPSWPASSPWVTAVGATKFVDEKVGNAEMASSQFGSGGGFSTMFSQTDASWQVEAVRAYRSSHPKDRHFPPEESIPWNGRATPDVSALGEGYQVVIGGRVSSVGGTSASAPAFAAMISLLNDARFQRGMKPLGFLNPFLYQHPNAFTDVLLGTNAIGRGTGEIPFGFNCTFGWDPATGLGTPKFDLLLDAAIESCNSKLYCSPWYKTVAYK